MLVNIRVVDKILTKDFITLMTHVHNKHIFLHQEKSPFDLRYNKIEQKMVLSVLFNK
jgi:hypothetical protein